MKLNELTLEVAAFGASDGTTPHTHVAGVRFASAPSEPGPLTAIVLERQHLTVDSGLEVARTIAAELSDWCSARDLWEALATIAADDLGAARAAEPHLDAVSILREAGATIAEGSYGVFASEGGVPPISAARTGDGWTLRGTKAWCSLAGQLDRALVTAPDDDGVSRLFDVSLRGEHVSVDESAWVARGLTEIPSGPVHFDDVEAVAIAGPAWYVHRPGFAWGGIGVAACWYGGAVAIARAVHAAAADRPTPFLSMHLGAIDVALQNARRALDEAANLSDGRSDVEPRILAKRVRASVVDACEEVLLRSGHALGPAPLALEAGHAKRVADLQLYIRQHHAETDQASLGDALAAAGAPW
jgi:hypothetical protein